MSEQSKTSPNQEQAPATHFAVPIEVFKEMMELVEEQPIKDYKKLWLALNNECKPMAAKAVNG